MRVTLMTTAAAMALALAGCKKPAPEARESDVTNSLTQVPADTEVAPPAEPAPPPAPPANVARVDPAPTPVERPVREEARIEDDADASGMTARLPADRDSQPADQGAEEAKDKQ